MNTIFMHSENNKIFHPHKLLLNFTDKIYLRRKDKYIIKSQHLLYQKNARKLYKNKKFEISAPT